MGVVGNLETPVVSLLPQELDTESHVQAVMPKSEGLIKCTRLTRHVHAQGRDYWMWEQCGNSSLIFSRILSLLPVAAL